MSETNRQEIIAIILDTQFTIVNGQPVLSQNRSRLGYVLDADVSNFGRDDFMEKRMKVTEELKLDLSDPEIKIKFTEFAIRLLKNHQWKTPAGEKLRQTGKLRNLKLLEEILNS